MAVGIFINTSLWCKESLLTPILELKRTPVVIGQLMWKPFNVRFSDLVEKLEHRHSTLFDELAVTNLSNMLDERTNAEASRKEMSEEQKRNQEEREAAAAEREMAQRERMLADAERRNNLEARSQTSSKLDQLLGKRQYTEDEYRGMRKHLSLISHMLRYPR